MEHGLLLQHMSTILKLCKQNNLHEKNFSSKSIISGIRYIVSHVHICCDEQVRIANCSIILLFQRKTATFASPMINIGLIFAALAWNGETYEDELDRFKCHN